MNLKEEIDSEIQSGLPFQIAGALISIGKNFLFEYRSFVEMSLKHEDAEVRAEALRVLTFYWKDRNYIGLAYRLITEEATEENREKAMMNWASYYRGACDSKILSELGRMAKDSTKPIKFRAMAIWEFFSVRSVNRFPLEFPEALSDEMYVAETEEEFESLVPWELIMPYL